MDILYPSTKFYIPRPRRNIVRRQRLFDLLNEGIRNKLISICAPAGYGKTTLVTSWLASLEMPIAWVSTDEGDNDIYRFCVCVLETLRENELLGGAKLRQMLHSPMPPSQDSLATLLLNEIAELQEDCILVIDDYHLITNPAVHSALHTVIEQSAQRLHFVLCSRTELPFSVSKLRAQSDLLELNQQELSLTLQESALYLNMVMGAGLKAQDVVALHERTEGWLAGLQLAALSIRDQQDPSAFIQNLKGDNRYVADYLVDEVLAHIPEDVQDFVFRTSVLNEMNASLCNFMLQIDNSQELLESLDRKRLFIIPLDEIRQSFRYHHLFREMLFDRLCRKSAGSLQGLYQRASTWHSLKGSKEIAVDYALAAGDFVAVRTLLADLWTKLLYRGKCNQLLGWHGKIPEAVFLDASELWLYYLMTLINAGAIVTTSRKLDQLEAEDLTAKTLSRAEVNTIRGNLAAVRGIVHIHSRADALEARKSLALARELLSEDNNIYDLVVAEFNYGVACLLSGELNEARTTFERSTAWSKKENISLGMVMGTSYLAETTAISGDLLAAHELLQSAVRYAHQWGVQEGAVFSKTNLELGKLYYEWNQLDLALQYLLEGVRLAEQGGYLEQLLIGYVHLARVQFLRRDVANIKESLSRLREFIDKYNDPPIALSFFEAARADLALLQGELGIASRWAERRHPSATMENTLFSEYEQLVRARVLRHRDDHFGMCELIRPMRERAASQGRIAEMIAYDVMIAKCFFMKGEPETALRILENALAFAEPGKFVRTFLDEGGVVVSMIKQLLTARTSKNGENHEVSLEYLHLLLDEAAKDTMKATHSSRTMNGVDGLEPLTSHEFKILQLLESGYTNKQISNELTISVNTVKYHLKNIYGKMGVANRTQASRALREQT